MFLFVKRFGAGSAQLYSKHVATDFELSLCVFQIAECALNRLLYFKLRIYFISSKSDCKQNIYRERECPKHFREFMLLVNIVHVFNYFYLSNL